MVTLYVVFRDRLIYPCRTKADGFNVNIHLIIQTLFVPYWLFLASWLVRWVWLNWRKYSVKTIYLYVLENYCTLTPLFCKLIERVMSSILCPWYEHGYRKSQLNLEISSISTSHSLPKEQASTLCSRAQSFFRKWKFRVRDMLRSYESETNVLVVIMEDFWLCCTRCQ